MCKNLSSFLPTGLNPICPVGHVIKVLKVILLETIHARIDRLNSLPCREKT